MPKKSGDKQSQFSILLSPKSYRARSGDFYLKTEVRCAKCFIPINLKAYRTYHSMGELHYGAYNNPHVCKSCFRAWRKVLDKIREKYPSEPIGKRWKKAFEKWIGYEWDTNNPYPYPEKVKFT